MRLERNEVKKLISEFIEKYYGLMVQISRVDDALNCGNCELFSAIYSLVNHDIRLIDQLTNDDEWLDWFITQNQYGMERDASIVEIEDADGKKIKREVNNVDDLLWAMGYDDDQR